jgi:glycosyltransferase involved in cell wall biosynthesis
MDPLDFSIVLPVYDDQKNLDRILTELAANTQSHNWEVIIVDDGSPKPLKVTPGAPEHVSLYRNESRRGAAASRNAGAKEARGAFLVFLSVFLKLPHNYIALISGFIKEHTFDIAQHLLVKETGTVADHFQTFLADQSSRIPNTGRMLPVKNTQFAAAILKKSTFSEGGGFDEDMNHYGGHELDLAYRLDKKGYSTRIIIEALPLERVSLESHERVRTRLQEYGRVGLPALLKKHPELKKTIIRYPLIWSLLKTVDLPKSTERKFKRGIEQNIKLTRRQYRLYLHLIMRNAWDDR